MASVRPPALLPGVSDHASRTPLDPSAPALCQNCSTPLSGPFCSQCGQHDIDYHRGFHHLFHDLLENLFHFEGKFFVTVAWLLAKPGRVTLEFLAGRRNSQLNPLRFYIFVSVMFFLGISLLNHGHLIDVPKSEIDKMQLQLSKQAQEDKDKGTSDFTDAEKKTLVDRRREALLKDPQKVDEAAIIKGIRRERRLANRPQTITRRYPGTITVDRNSGVGRELSDKLGSGELSVGEVFDAVEHRIPSLLFLGVPLFALLLKLFYLRSNRFYVEHLIFSLHLHTWLFLALMVGYGYEKLASLGPGWLETLTGWALFLWGC